MQFGGESANPQRDLPRAVIYSMLIGAVIYILLQVVFIGAAPAHSLPRTRACGLLLVSVLLISESLVGSEHPPELAIAPVVKSSSPVGR
jgi:amino acid transporter